MSDSLDPAGTVINIFDLARTRDNREQAKASVYKEVLRLIHSRIKAITAKGEVQCLYPIPEFIPGLPRFDLVPCLAYLIKKLRENGFLVRFTAPNILYISWAHVPSTIRNPEVKALERQMIAQPNMDYSTVFQKILNKSKINAQSLPETSLQRINNDAGLSPSGVVYRPIQDFKAPSNYITNWR
jgi:hypothetical protein